MLLSEPGKTDYDLNFNLFGFNVRTHPSFFIMPILIGRNLIDPGVNTGVGWLLLIAIFYVSILVHELGHAFAFRKFGIHSRIVLYWMGGLAIPDSGNAWSSQSSRGLTPNQQITVSLAGPIFGFLLAGLLIGIVYSIGGFIVNVGEWIPVPLPNLLDTSIGGNASLRMIFTVGILINVFLNILNLVPIFPLDGGQATRQVMLQIDSHSGLRNSIILSMATAILIAVFSLQTGDQFLAFFFGFMAYSNYQSLQQYGSGPRW